MTLLPFSQAAVSDLAATYAQGKDYQLTEMPGGASLRRFFRVQVEGDPPGVIMFFPDAHGSDELTAGERPKEWPFLEVRALLENSGVRVPQLLASRCEQGLIIVEDLGPNTLAEALQDAPERKLMLYQRAVSDLAEAQKRLRELPDDSIVRSRSFDIELLNWELQHFLEWGVDGRQLQISDAARSEFDDLAGRLAERIHQMPYGFVHRDYQSRNLMVLDDGNLAWVDFQDALMGPRVYDLVALLGDSYQSFSHDFVLDRLREYCSAMGIARELPEIYQEFDRVMVQRKLKDAGRFVFIEHKKGDSSYLKFVEPTLAKVRMALSRLNQDPDMRALEEWMAHLG